MTGLSGEGVRVVLVGTGTHAPGSRLPEVPTVAASQAALRSCFVEVCGVREQNLNSLVDPEGPEPFLDAVIKAASAASDVLLLYYVGHGVLNFAGQLHLATRATVDLTNKASFQALAYSEIVGALSNCRARLVVVVLDCCYSGRVNVPVRTGALLASADKDEQALAPVGEEYTAFSGELIRALREGIPTAPAQLKLQHLHEHLSRTMRRQNRTVPILQTGNLAGELVLAPNRADHSHSPDDDFVPPWEGACPFRGLEAFTAEDERLFHGRAELVDHILQRLGERVCSGGVTVVAGPSGSGKTSVLFAGVLPAIAHGDLGVVGSSGWPQISLTPGEDPLGVLAARLAQLGPEQEKESIRTELAAGPERARAAARWVTSGAMPPAVDDAGGRLVIVVDQFEEVFAPGVPDPVRHAFIAALDAVATRVESDEPAAVVILGLRSDFSGQFARFPELLTALESNQVLVGPMTTAALRSAIVEPAQQAGLALQPGLVDLLLRDTGADPGDDQSADYDPGALPLLSHALLATWQRRRGNLLTVDGYREIGGVAGAISMTAERTFSALVPAVQQAARWVLLQMVRVGDDIPDTRRRVNPADLLDALPDKTATATALKVFSDARLITVARDTMEITHEALIRSWPRLRQWINADRIGRLLTQDIETAANDWEGGSHDTSLLYRGSRLAAAHEHAQTSRPGDLSPGALNFLTASNRQQRRASLLRRGAVAALIVLLFASSATAVYAFQQRAGAIFNQIVAEADQLSPADHSLATQLDLSAYRIKQDPEVRIKLIASENIPLSRVLPDSAGIAHSAAFSPDGHTIASASADRMARLWNVSDPAHPAALSRLTGHTDAVLSVMFSPDGHTLATASVDQTVRLWNVVDPAHPVFLNQISGFGDTVGSVAFSPDGLTLATGSADHTVRLWNVSEPAHPLLLSQLNGHNASVGSVAFSPDGRTLATGSFDHTARLWNVTDLSFPTLIAQLPHNDIVHSVAFSPNGQLLATGCNDHTVELWDLRNIAHPTPAGQPFTANDSGVLSVAISPDGHTLATGGADRATRLWDVTNPTNPILIGQPLTGHTNTVTSVAFSRDGHYLAATSVDQTVRLWHIPQTVLTGQQDTIASLAFSPDGHTLATASGDHTVRLWDLTDAERPIPIGRFLGHGDAIYTVAFSPDGRMLATGSADRTVRLWSLATPKQPTLLGQPLAAHSSEVTTVAFSPDGRILATGSSDHTAKLWDLTKPAQPTLLAKLKGHDDTVFSVAYSPDGRTLATGSADNTVKLWNILNPADPTLRSNLVGHSDIVLSVAFSPDGRTLASGSNDHTVRLWDLTDPSRPSTLGELVGGNAATFSVAFSHDGHTLASGNEDATARLWNLDINAAIGRACKDIGPSLTLEQWHRYAPQLTPEQLCRV